MKRFLLFSFLSSREVSFSSFSSHASDRSPLPTIRFSIILFHSLPIPFLSCLSSESSQEQFPSVSFSLLSTFFREEKTFPNQFDSMEHEGLQSIRIERERKREREVGGWDRIRKITKLHVTFNYSTNEEKQPESELIPTLKTFSFIEFMHKTSRSEF